MDDLGRMLPTAAEPPNGHYAVRDTADYGIPGGKQLLARYPNGYGASVVSHPYSYGGRDGLFELAVQHPEELCYATPITSDVIGYLDPTEVVVLLHRIAQLPPNSDCDHGQDNSGWWFGVDLARDE